MAPNCCMPSMTSPTLERDRRLWSSTTHMAKNHKLWYAWVPILAQTYRVVRFDMRGIGQYVGPRAWVPLGPWRTYQRPLGCPGPVWSCNGFTSLVRRSVAPSPCNLRRRTRSSLLSLAICTCPVTFDAHHTETADLIDREGVAALGRTRYRAAIRITQLVTPAVISAGMPHDRPRPPPTWSVSSNGGRRGANACPCYPA